MGKKDSTEKSTVKKGKLMPPWEPGQSGNPKGYPKGVPNRCTLARKVLEMDGLLPKLILEKLKQLFPAIGKKMSVEEIMDIRMAGRVIIEGDVGCYNAIMDSAYGRPSQAITGESGGAIEIKIEDEHTRRILEAGLKNIK